MIESNSVDRLARQLCDNVLEITAAAPNNGLRWTVLSIFAEGHRRAAAFIEAEAALIRVEPNDPEIKIDYMEAA